MKIQERVRRSIQLFPKILWLLIGSLVIGSHAYCQDVVVDGSRLERSLLEMYEEDDLGACCLFTGDFINFGYWKEIVEGEPITAKQRLESSKALYHLVASSIDISSADKVLEVGCGKGVGASLILKEFTPHEIRGIDFSSAQIRRARHANAAIITEEKKLSFHCGAAENIPFPSSSFDKIISIEAAQHFEDLEKFSKESYRVLTPGGRLAMATFFANSPQAAYSIASMIQTVHDGIDKMNPIKEMRKFLENAGYQNIKIESIGANVWPYFDRWVAQGDLRNSWTRNWYKAYRQGLMDYYVITAEKPQNLQTDSKQVGKGYKVLMLRENGSSEDK